MSQERRYSFEFFPTKTEAGHEKLMDVARQLATYNPDFFSCTYGAGGSTRDRTLNTVLQLDGEVGVPTAPHLSCVGDSTTDLRSLLQQYQAAGIRRIVETLTGVLASILAFYFTYAVGALALKSWRFNDVSFGFVPVPLWLPQGVMALGLLLLGIAMIDLTWRSASRGEPMPGASEV